jgi:hypothetical protein
VNACVRVRGAGTLCFDSGIDICFGVLSLFAAAALVLNAIMSSISHAADIKSSSALSRPHAYLEIANALNVLLLVVRTGASSPCTDKV